MRQSILSYLAGHPSHDLLIAACQQATHDWWQHMRPRCELFASQLVVAEASRGDLDASAQRLSYLAGIPELAITEEVRELAERLVVEGALPAKAQADAIHIAVAAVHRIDLLLTWNCRHIDNPVTKPLARSVCAVAGFPCPEICTPIELLEGASNEE